MRDSPSIEYEVPTNSEQLKLFADYLVKVAQLGKDLDDADNSRSRKIHTKNKSKADLVKDLTEDIKYARECIQEYTQELEENSKKLEDLLQNGIPEPVVNKKKSKKKVEIE